MTDPRWWWNIPEFVAAQEDPDFRAWVQSVELGIELHASTPSDWFPGIPEDDWFSDEAITFVESALLERYEDTAALQADFDGQVPFIKYHGLLYVEKLEGKWVSIPEVPDRWPLPGWGVELPWRYNGIYDVMPALRVAVRRRKGDQWLFTFNNNRESYLNWKNNGIVIDMYSNDVPLAEMIQGSD
ncbi:hypothetical protein [Mycobacteroides abscessus]|nr:hypothetical protein [Mycobacteroides abscessus]MBN7379719.1 hypothetical protein [Mycobacteroides abscessus subsp. massiliense]MDM2096373.1 hypothetical protein [Mycobacteroides abscessus]MDM2121104.1 hypothetical protein [Mycobacteroides abscessus]MDM2124401.1 hypothetical protein [Mycobacteroides abscessus]MDM2130586.1 hypothetical protein [Mycobacteroides abscessus]